MQYFADDCTFDGILFVHYHTIYSISERLSNTWVIVSNAEYVAPNEDNICNEIIDGAQDVVTVTCNYRNKISHLRGRYVTIRRQDNAGAHHLLNFCEVEVLSCHPGSWGIDPINRDCSQSCGRCVEETCGVSDGHCYTGCQEGYWGPNCDNQCHCQPCERIAGCTTGVPQLNFVLLCILSLENAISFVIVFRI